MSTYYVITAEVLGEIKTGLVDKEEFEADGSDPSFYFPSNARVPEVHGTVEISGPAEHMIPTSVVE